MSTVINTNLASLAAQRNLAVSGADVQTALERLSSGLRINSAKDDAAGLAIAWLIAQGDHVLPIPGTRSVERLRELAVGAERTLTSGELAQVEKVLPIGWCHGDRYNQGQWNGPEKYC